MEDQRCELPQNALTLHMERLCMPQYTKFVVPLTYEYLNVVIFNLLLDSKDSNLLHRSKAPQTYEYLNVVIFNLLLD